MKLRKTWFLSAIARILASASTSVIGAGSASGAGDLMLRRHDRVGHRLERVVADHAQHLRDLGIVGADVALEEGVVVLEFAQAKRAGLAAWSGASEGLMKPGVRMPHVEVPLCPFA